MLLWVGGAVCLVQCVRILQAHIYIYTYVLDIQPISQQTLLFYYKERRWKKKFPLFDVDSRA